MRDEEQALDTLVNADRQNMGVPWLMPDFQNVFMRSRPGQMIEAFNQSFAAAAIGTLNGTLAQRRGTVQAVRIVAMSSTIGDIDQDTFTLIGNGVEIITDAPLAYYSPLFDSYNNKREYVAIPQNSTFSLRIDRTNGVNPVFVYAMFYYAATMVLPPVKPMDPR